MGYILVLIIFSAVLFLKILPEMGHQMLLRDQYYGLYTEATIDISEIKCYGNDVQKVRGKFLGIYPYDAFMTKGCLTNPENHRQNHVFIRIDARKPHTFLQVMTKITDEQKSNLHQKIFYKTYPEIG